MTKKIPPEESARLRAIFKQRRLACLACETPCNPMPSIFNLKKKCPLPVSRWDEVDAEKMGIGDFVEIFAKPVARLLKMDCLDGDGRLKPESGCAKRREALNRLSQ